MEAAHGGGDAAEQEEEPEDEDADLRTSAIDGPGAENPEGQSQELNHDEIDLEEESEEASICLNSSNSNIEEEFEQIKM